MRHIVTLLEDFFGVSPDTSATILITILIFIIGLLFQQAFLGISEFHKRWIVRRMFRFSINNISNQTIKQARAYKESMETLKFDKKTNFEFKRTPIIRISSINNISYSECFTAYFTGFENILKLRKKTRIKAFNKIWNALEAIEYWHKNLLMILKNSFNIMNN